QIINTQAPMLAQKKMAELFNLSSNELVDDGGRFGDDFVGYTWKTSVESVSSEMLGGMAEDLKRIDLTISFNNDERTYRLRAYRFVED
ncbi:MAG: hypothetical protein P8Y38_06640, partial [Deltaproteobacteria bacterium]